MSNRIVIAEDDQEMRELLKELCLADGHRVHAFGLATEALEYVKQNRAEVDLIVSDINMPQMDGMQFMHKVKQLDASIPFIIITAFGSIDNAIDAIRKGAYDYIVKPFQIAELQVTINRALGFSRLSKDNQVLRQQIQGDHKFDNIIGKSKVMQNLFDLIQRVARANSNVLITGESGTGKELVARSVHNHSPRKDKPFVAINCAAIPENLLESELFGHAKGSFTGAIQRKRGLFEEANGGTVFLDEIGDLDFTLQAKILRVLQEKQIRAVGDNVSKDVDVRVIAATHQDLKERMQKGMFREDLYYRLAVIPMHIPPLRERKDDIPILANHFLAKYATANGLDVRGFTHEAMQQICAMPLKGNVRELENIIERAVVLCPEKQIRRSDLPAVETEDVEHFYEGAIEDLPTLETLEKRYIHFVLGKTNSQKSNAAKILGINRRTLYRKEREYGFVADNESSRGH